MGQRDSGQRRRRRRRWRQGGRRCARRSAGSSAPRPPCTRRERHRAACASAASWPGPAVTRTARPPSRLGRDAGESVRVEHPSGADPGFVVVRHHHRRRPPCTAAVRRCRRSVGALMTSPMPTPGLAHRQAAEGDLVVTRRLPTGGDHRADRRDAGHGHERLDVELTVVASSRSMPGIPAAATTSGWAATGRPEALLVLLAVADVPDDGVEVGAEADRVRGHLADGRQPRRRRPRGRPPPRRCRPTAETIGTPAPPSHAAQGAASSPAPTGGGPGHAHRHPERSCRLTAAPTGTTPAPITSARTAGTPTASTDPVHRDAVCPRSPPADTDGADRARGDDGDGADRGGDDCGQRSTGRWRRRPDRGGWRRGRRAPGDRPTRAGPGGRRPGRRGRLRRAAAIAATAAVPLDS